MLADILVLASIYILLASGFLELNSNTPILALMIGLAVGIDYALFIVSRYRHELSLGRDPEEAAYHQPDEQALGALLLRLGALLGDALLISFLDLQRVVLLIEQLDESGRKYCIHQRKRSGCDSRHHCRLLSRIGV